MPENRIPVGQFVQLTGHITLQLLIYNCEWTKDGHIVEAFVACGLFSQENSSLESSAERTSPLEWKEWFSRYQPSAISILARFHRWIWEVCHIGSLNGVRCSNRYQIFQLFCRRERLLSTNWTRYALLLRTMLSRSHFYWQATRQSQSRERVTVLYYHCQLTVAAKICPRLEMVRRFSD